MKILGCDIGYYATKTVWANGQKTYPSVVGTANVSSFKTGDNGDVLVEIAGNRYLLYHLKL